MLARARSVPRRAAAQFTRRRRLGRMRREVFELEVVERSSRPLNVLSFEYAAEVLDGTRGRAERLVELGARAFNYSPGESMEHALRDWSSAREMLAALPAGSDTLALGDVYARFS